MIFSVDGLKLILIITGGFVAGVAVVVLVICAILRARNRGERLGDREENMPLETM